MRDERDVRRRRRRRRGGGRERGWKIAGGKSQALKPAELVTSMVQNVQLPLELGGVLDQWTSPLGLCGQAWACLEKT